MCLEEVYSHADYPRTAILMGHARGVICLAAKLEGIPVLSFSAKRVKQSVTGNGNASKSQVQRAVQNFFSLDQRAAPTRRGRCPGRRAVLCERAAVCGAVDKGKAELESRNSEIVMTCRVSSFDSEFRQSPEPGTDHGQPT